LKIQLIKEKKSHSELQSSQHADNTRVSFNISKRIEDRNNKEFAKYTLMIAEQ